MQVARGLLEFFIFIQDFICSFITPNGEVTLPDDILIDILSRLPADCIQQCHKVCKNWRALTSTRWFAEMQFRRAESMIYVQCYHYMDMNDPLHLLVFDEKFKKFKKANLKWKGMIAPRKFDLRLRGSYCGLLVFRSTFPCAGCVVIDPFNEVVKYIYFPLGPFEVCGIFFQPLASEYKILICSYSDREYYVYGSKSLIWRNITYGSFSFRPHVPSPIILNQALHWMVDPNFVYEKEIDLCMHAVMVFDMESEKFHTLPHPNINREHECADHRMMYLFAKGESLYMCNMLLIFHGQIEMWVLEDYQNWIWVKRHRLDVRMLPRLNMLPIMQYFDERSCCNISILSINKDELLIDWFSYGLYILNVTRMTLIKLKEMCDLRRYRSSKLNLFTSHRSCMHPSVS